MLDENIQAIHLPTPSEKDNIDIKNASASWVPNSIANTLYNVNAHIQAGTLCALIGPVGSGKVN